MLISLDAADCEGYRIRCDLRAPITIIDAMLLAIIAIADATCYFSRHKRLRRLCLSYATIRFDYFRLSFFATYGIYDAAAMLLTLSPLRRFSLYASFFLRHCFSPAADAIAALPRHDAMITPFIASLADTLIAAMLTI